MGQVTTRRGVIIGGPEVVKKRIIAVPSLAVPIVGSFLALRHLILHGVTWLDVASYLFFYIITGLGVTIGLHRYFTHRSFKAHPAVAYTLGALASMAAQPPLKNWVADHRRHHAAADQAADPHSPSYDTWGMDTGGFRGWFHAHAGWLLDGTATDLTVYGKNLDDDPVIRFFTRTHAFWPLLSLALPYGLGYLIGGADAAWSSLLFGGFLRMAAVHQSTMSINSFGHLDGFRTFETKDTSTNKLILALVSGGEGWHNNHHRFPRSYRSGLYRGQIDTSAWVIRQLSKLGLTYDLVDNSGIEPGTPLPSPQTQPSGLS